MRTQHYQRKLEEGRKDKNNVRKKRAMYMKYKAFLLDDWR
jgi:hypothetical protein